MSIASQAFQSAKIFPRSESFTLGIVGLGPKFKKRQDRRRVESFGGTSNPGLESGGLQIGLWMPPTSSNGTEACFSGRSPISSRMVEVKGRKRTAEAQQKKKKAVSGQAW